MYNIIMSSLQKEGHLDDFSRSLLGAEQVFSIQRNVESVVDPRLSFDQGADLTNSFIIFE